MIFLFFLFPISLLVVVVAGAWHLHQKGWSSPAFRICRRIFAYLVICYVISFAAVCMHPYWEDNGVEEFIPTHERWGWAILYASLFQLILSPALWAMSWVIGKKRQALAQVST